ncbi:MAG TPA: hypothetical protein VHF25_02025 [Nitriliruptorales bacterium]|nr:hypothetical protein [Nitriliruptorales bacterium]
MSRLRLAAGVGLAVALAVALVVVLLQDRAQRTRAGNAVEPPPPGPSVSPSPSPSPEASQPVAVPTPDTTGRDFDHIVRELIAFRDWLFAHPDPELVSLIYHPECECHDAFREELEELLADGVRFDPEGTDTIVHRIEVLEDFPSLFRVDLTMQAPAQRLLNRDGEVVARHEGGSPQTFNMAFLLDGDRWRLRTSVEVAP